MDIMKIVEIGIVVFVIFAVGIFGYLMTKP